MTDDEDNDARVSLAPLDPEAALRALLAVRPEGRNAEPEGDRDDRDTERKASPE